MNTDDCSKSSYNYNSAVSKSSYTSASHGEESDSAPPMAERPSWCKNNDSKAKKKKTTLCGIRFAVHACYGKQMLLQHSFCLPEVQETGSRSESRGQT